MLETKDFVAGALAISAALVGGGVAIYLERRRASLQHAREKSPQHLAVIYVQGILLRDAIQDFGHAWSMAISEFDQLPQDFYKILISRAYEFNRSLSPSTSDAVFQVPSNIENKAEDIRKVINNAIRIAKFDKSVQVRNAIVNELGGTFQTMQETNSFPKKYAKSDRIRYIETRRAPRLANSPFCDVIFRKRVVESLDILTKRIKELTVD